MAIPSFGAGGGTGAERRIETGRQRTAPAGGGWGWPRSCLRHHINRVGERPSRRANAARLSPLAAWAPSATRASEALHRRLPATSGTRSMTADTDRVLGIVASLRVATRGDLDMLELAAEGGVYWTVGDFWR